MPGPRGGDDDPGAAQEQGATRAAVRPTREVRDVPRTVVRGRWQVFGLVGAELAWIELVEIIPTDRRFPAPRTEPVLLTAFVPTHRCGAVPESHQVPSCPGAPPAGDDPDQPQHHIQWFDQIDGTTSCDGVSGVLGGPERLSACSS
ncbi:hypothetical protein GCM10009844_17260 [Nocardioides koreensis]|uniref:Uncharacterized protein n=1 Tax=Nocardioides koreensis TaxID=433651 RepID=A0ABN2ZLP9_9ACTN